MKPLLYTYNLSDNLISYIYFCPGMCAYRTLVPFVAVVQQPVKYSEASVRSIQET